MEGWHVTVHGSRAVRGRTKIPGDDSPGAALCAVRASGYALGKDGSAERRL
jgi:hypothetical protein